MAQKTISSPQCFSIKAFTIRYTSTTIYCLVLKKQPDGQNLDSISAAEKQTSKIRNM